MRLWSSLRNSFSYILFATLIHFPLFFTRPSFLFYISLLTKTYCSHTILRFVRQDASVHSLNQANNVYINRNTSFTWDTPSPTAAVAVFYRTQYSLTLKLRVYCMSRILICSHRLEVLLFGLMSSILFSFFSVKIKIYILLPWHQNNMCS